MSAATRRVELCGLVAHLNQRLDAHIRRVADGLGITSSQAIALRELSEPMTLSELAERMSCEASNASYVIDRMERQGLVQRRPHPTDRRAKRLVLTAGGESCRGNVLTALAQDSPVESLTAAEQTTLAKLLRKAAD
ncbi:MarR family winged helix-turn-helix transcriptional regulator [Streptomyces sp. NPDC058045]|uniref:MarR family winged helix-turn-helix transcriptional regulator n=1 Tax=Streptomyces sp. NPDC058045 TaxID=3346311 RepID=UPI0036E9740C